MKFLRAYSGKMLKNTLGVIFNVPNTKWVERYLRRWTKLQKEHIKRQNEMEKESLCFDIMKFNKEIQAEWFQGPTIENPSIPIQYKDRWNQIVITNNLVNIDQNLENIKTNNM